MTKGASELTTHPVFYGATGRERTLEVRYLIMGRSGKSESPLRLRQRRHPVLSRRLGCLFAWPGRTGLWYTATTSCRSTYRSPRYCLTVFSNRYLVTIISPAE
jgi:hypothetical protein